MPGRTRRDLSAIGLTIRDVHTGGDTIAIGDGTTEEGGGPLGDGLWLANRFLVDVEDPELPYAITMTVAAVYGRLACEDLHMRKLGNGPPVTGMMIRTLVFDSYLALLREKLRATGLLRLHNYSRRAVPHVAARDEWAALVAPPEQRTGPVQVQKVVDLYRQALASDNDAVRLAPNEAIAQALRISRGHAARLIVRARREGLLAPAVRGRAGEQAATA